MPQQIYTVELDGKHYDLEGDHPPTEAEARAAIGAMKPVASHESSAPERTWTDTAVDLLPTAGGVVGGLAMSELGPVGAAVGAGGGGMVGERVKQYVNALRGKEALPSQGEAVSRMGGEGLTQAGAEVGGRMIGAGLRTVGRGLYRAGAMPILQMTSKYDDLINTGLKERVPVSKSGLAKAKALATEAKDTKAVAVQAAGTKAGIRTRGVVDDALQKAGPMADKQRRAGLGDPMGAFNERADRIVTENGPGLRPDQLEDIKGTVDDTLGPAYRKVRSKEALSPDERFNMELSHAASRAQEAVIPNYRDLNKNVMDRVGLERMIARRIGPKGTGVNQGLENIATAMIGPSAIPARIAMLPPVASRAGIAAHIPGEHPQAISNALRAALLGLMVSHGQEDQ